MCSLPAPLRLSAICATLHLCVSSAVCMCVCARVCLCIVCVCVCVCASVRLLKLFFCVLRRRGVLPVPPPPPHPSLPSPLPWLLACPSHDCSDKFNPEKWGWGWYLLPDCFSWSVMEMRFSISLHLKYLNTSLLRMRLSGLLAHFPAWKCSVVLQSWDEF